MESLQNACIWLAELLPLAGALAAFLYGVSHFFKKGKALYLQSITMAMGCHALCNLYRICQLITDGQISDGFSPAYLGRMGFFLFFLAANYGQMDRIVDDGSKLLKPSRIKALGAPLLVILLLCVSFCSGTVSDGRKVILFLICLPAGFAMYFNVKHAIFPDIDFGFVKALRPYNICAACLGFSELVCLMLQDYLYNIPLAAASLIFGVLCIATIAALKKGVDQWAI